MSLAQLRALSDRARLGDWAEYDLVIRVDDAATRRARLLVEVVGIDDLQVRLRSTRRAVTRRDAPGPRGTEALGAPVVTHNDLPRGSTWIEAWTVGVRQSGPNLRVVQLVPGRETLTIGGRRLACDVMGLQFEGDLPRRRVSGRARYWISPDVTLQGIARAEIRSVARPADGEADLAARSVEVRLGLRSSGGAATRPTDEPAPNASGARD